MNSLLKYIDVNLETGEITWSCNWTAGNGVKRFKGEDACTYGNKYPRIAFMGKNFFAHRIIWFVANNSLPDGLEIDHIDRDCNNNRISNLRLVTKQENALNRHFHPEGGYSVRILH